MPPPAARRGVGVVDRYREALRPGRRALPLEARRHVRAGAAEAVEHLRVGQRLALGQIGAGERERGGLDETMAARSNENMRTCRGMVGRLSSPASRRAAFGERRAAAVDAEVRRLQARRSRVMSKPAARRSESRMRRAAGHQVRVDPGTLAPTLGIGARGIKTDRRDAQVLSEVSSASICRRCISHGRPRAPPRRCAACATASAQPDAAAQYGARVGADARLSAWPAAACCRSAPGCRRPVGRDAAQTMSRASCRHSSTCTPPMARRRPGGPDLAEAIDCAALDDRARRGPVTAVRFVAAMMTGRALQARMRRSVRGLVAGQRSSGDRTRHLGITKPAARPCAGALVQAAHCAKRTLPAGRCATGSRA